METIQHKERKTKHTFGFKILDNSKVFGVIFMIKLLEGNQEKGQVNYSKTSKEAQIHIKYLKLKSRSSKSILR